MKITTKIPNKEAINSMIESFYKLKKELEILSFYTEESRRILGKEDEAYDFVRIPSNLYEKDIKNITIKINQVIEKMILQDPKQWIWSHNRWK